MVSVCCLLLSFLCACLQWQLLSLLCHSVLCMLFSLSSIWHKPFLLSPCMFVYCLLSFFCCSVLLVYVVPCCAVRPLCCLPLVLSFRKGLWGRLWWVELSKPDRLVHRSTCTTAAMMLALVPGRAEPAQKPVRAASLLIEHGHKLKPLMLPFIYCRQVKS